MRDNENYCECDNAAIRHQVSPPRDSRWNDQNEGIQTAARVIPERTQGSRAKTVRHHAEAEDPACWWERRPAAIWTPPPIPPEVENCERQCCDCCPCPTGIKGKLTIELNPEEPMISPVSLDDTMVIKRPTNYKPWWENNKQTNSNRANWDKSMPKSTARKPQRQ
ncbi:hypothetical protein DAPPUDRAFT_99816 [Daphnia pulex]|uniref:Uncharacterized protein n=1 Tax=Daphnia pulex TaxID=6669 RepID=E9G8D9_DAPPU|nr:hypothetical protein DAPPUDRAFT_99816 [Daphnia pulex]|eukprot:EFX83958.1 hypothetical protein DAPPUDRAFT_99816 [Daphnia pulex]